MDKNGWIPVEEQLPSLGDEVLISALEWVFGSQQPYVTSAVFSCKGDWCYTESGRTIDFVPVLAWQPLPEPYRNE